MVTRKPDVAVINSDVVSALDSHTHTLGQDSTSKMLHLTGSSAVTQSGRCNTQVKRHCTGGDQTEFSDTLHRPYLPRASIRSMRFHLRERWQTVPLIKEVAGH